MSNDRIEELISAELDGELDAAGAEELRLALESDPSLAEVREDFVNIGKMMREAEIPEALSPEATWQAVREEIHTLPDETEEPAAAEQEKVIPMPAPATPAPWKWGIGLAAAAALVMAAVVLSNNNRGGAAVELAAADTEVEFISTDLEGAVTVVNVEPESGITVIWVIDTEEENEG